MAHFRIVYPLPETNKSKQASNAQHTCARTHGQTETQTETERRSHTHTHTHTHIQTQKQVYVFDIPVLEPIELLQHILVSGGQLLQCNLILFVFFEKSLACRINLGQLLLAAHDSAQQLVLFLCHVLH